MKIHQWPYKDKKKRNFKFKKKLKFIRNTNLSFTFMDKLIHFHDHVSNYICFHL